MNQDNQAGPKPARKRSSLAERVARGIDDAIDACKRGANVAKQWTDQANKTSSGADDDDRDCLVLAMLACEAAVKQLDGVAQIYRDSAPISALLVEFAVGDFVTIKAKDRATFEAVVDDPASLSGLCVAKIVGATIVVRTEDGEKLILKRSQIELSDKSLYIIGTAESDETEASGDVDTVTDEDEESDDASAFIAEHAAQ
jgi:hypothetical protein